MPADSLPSAFVIDELALASGQTPATPLFTAASLHFERALTLACRNLELSFAMDRWHFTTVGAGGRDTHGDGE